jgi:hypothetical protein
MTQSSSQTDKSRNFRQVPTPLKLFFFPVLGLVLFPLCVVSNFDLIIDDITFFCIFSSPFWFSVGMTVMLVLGGDYSAYMRFKQSSSSTEAVVLRKYSETMEADDLPRTSYYLVLRFTIPGPSGDAQEIRGVLNVKQRMYSSKGKGSKVNIQYATQDPYVISLENA